jgi:FkbM family methyltransferase
MNNLLVRLLHLFGYDVTVRKPRGFFELIFHRRTKHIDSFVTIQRLLKFYEPKILYDIGSNEGMWAETLAELDPRLEEIVFFEPQSKYQEQLKDFKPAHIRRRVFQAGLSDENTELEITGGSASASFLPVDETYAFKADVKQESEKVTVYRLDDMVGIHNLPVPDVIKIDVQGYEYRVLKGALQTLAKTKFLVLELSFDEFYKGQEPLSMILALLEQHHFILVDTGFEWRKDYKANNRLLQVDGIFANKSIIKID